MRSALLVCVALCGCASTVRVLREEAPRQSLAIERQPVRISPQETGVVLVDVLNLFTDAHARDQAASDQLAGAFHRSGALQLTNGCDGETCSAPASELFVTVTTMKLEGEPGAQRTATVQLALSLGDETWKVDGTATHGADDATVMQMAMTDAADRFAAQFLPSQQLEDFTLREGPALGPINKQLRGGDAGGAAQAYRAQVEANPDDVAAWHNLAVALTALGDLPGAATAAARTKNEDFASAAAERAKHTARVVWWGDGRPPPRTLRIWPEATIRAR